MTQNPASALCLNGRALMEQNDEWQVGRQYMSLETLAHLNMRVMEGTQAKL